MPYKPDGNPVQTWSDVIDHDGKVAVTHGWEICNDTPEEVRYVTRSDIPADLYADLLGHQIHVWSVNRAVIIKNMRRYILDTETWDRVIDRRPIKKPRAGKQQGSRYDWQWEPNYVGNTGRWVQFWID